MEKAYTKAKTTKAFAIARGDEILFDAIEPWTDDGRAKLLRGINRQTERLVTIRITEIDH